MKYQAAIFDFDYTLGDSTEGIVLCVNDALTRMNIAALPADKIRRTVGMTLQEMFRHMTGISDTREGERFRRYFMEKADAVMTSSTVLYPDTIQVLSVLKSHGLKTGIVTTKNHGRVTAILDKFGIRHLVDVIVGYDDVKNPKPHPEALYLAIESLRVLPGDVIYIGDSEIDAEITQRACVDFIAVTTGTADKDIFQKYPHVAVVPSLSGILGSGLLQRTTKKEGDDLA